MRCCALDPTRREGIYYSGLITSHPTGTEDYSIRGKFRVPINLHIGNIGLAPKYDRTVDSVPPMMSGGNMDDRRIGKGASLFLPVQVKGALLSAGDAHASQGDSGTYARTMRSVNRNYSTQCKRYCARCHKVVQPMVFHVPTHEPP